MTSLFVVGDSISCYYGKYLEPMLAGRFVYDRKGGRHKLDDLDDCTNGINGGDSSMVLTYLKSAVEMEFFRPDVLLLNCGLHDTKRIGSSTAHQVSFEDYEVNLCRICEIVLGHGYPMVWVRTTPVRDFPTGTVPDEQQVVRYNDDVIRVNSIADRIMTVHKVPIIDLYTFTRNLGAAVYSDYGVHFNEEIAAKQAAFIAGALWSMGDAE